MRPYWDACVFPHYCVYFSGRIRRSGVVLTLAFWGVRMPLCGPFGEGWLPVEGWVVEKCGGVNNLSSHSPGRGYWPCPSRSVTHQPPEPGLPPGEACRTPVCTENGRNRELCVITGKRVHVKSGQLDSGPARLAV